MKYVLPALAMLVAITAEAQTHVEIRGGATIGSHSGSRAGLELVPGPSLDVTVRRDLTGNLSVYGSFSRLEFGCEDQFCAGSEPTITGNHGVLGAEVGWRNLWARAGGMFGTAAMSVTDDAQTGFGMQGSAGLRFDVRGAVQVVQAFTLERMQSRTAVGTDWATAVSFDLGLAYALQR